MTVDDYKQMSKVSPHDPIRTLCIVVLTAALLFLIYRINIVLNNVNTTAQAVPPVLSSTKSAVDDLDKAVNNLDKTVSTLDATIVDVRRTVLIAGGTLNIVRDTMRDEKESAEAAVESSHALVKNSTILVNTANASLLSLTESVNKALGPVPPLLDQTRENLLLLEATEEQLTPLAKNTSDTMEHVSGITADTQYEIHKFVYPPPQPWYDKYIINPAKIIFHMLTIPLRK